MSSNEELCLIIPHCGSLTFIGRPLNTGLANTYIYAKDVDASSSTKRLIETIKGSAALKSSTFHHVPSLIL
jgi:hypothetical protein